MVTRDRDRRNKFTGGNDSSDEDDDDDDNDDNDDDERVRKAPLRLSMNNRNIRTQFLKIFKLHFCLLFA